MKLTMFLLLLPVVLFWSYTESWRYPQIFFCLWTISAAACAARGFWISQRERWIGALCIATVAFQIMFLITPQLLHARLH